MDAGHREIEQHEVDIPVPLERGRQLVQPARLEDFR
jgi:hypothetical protein